MQHSRSTKRKALRDEQVQLPLTELDRVQMLDEELDSYYLCRHCERTYPVGLVRLVSQGKETLQLCPYEGCDGDTVFDAVPWRELRETDTSLPETPEWGVEYIL